MDGAMGTLVEDAGWSVKSALWGSEPLLSGPGQALIRELHRRYVEAGADLVIANTHNASWEYAARWLRENPARTSPQPSRDGDAAAQLMAFLNRTAVREAREAGASLVAGCLASPDTPYTRRATRTPRDMSRALEPQLRILSELEVDLIIFEMCTTMEDIEGLTLALDRVGPSQPVGVGLVCGEDRRLLAGANMRAVSGALAVLEPTSVFVQCTRWDLIEAPLIELADSGLSAILGAYGNDGRVWCQGEGWQGGRVHPDTYAEAAERWWRRAGAQMLGGCCGTDPSFIRAIAQRLGDRMR